jgi:hypothetical protein
VFIRLRSGTKREVTDAPPARGVFAGAWIWVTYPVTDQSPTYALIQAAGTR